MIKISCLPILVRSIFRGLPGIWKGRHLLLLYWFVFMQAIVPGKKTVKEISRRTPFHIPEWRLRRLLKATYWTAEIVITWFAWEAMNSFPQPKDGVLYMVGDSGHKNKRGEKNPVVRKGRENKNGPWFFGIRHTTGQKSGIIYNYNQLNFSFTESDFYVRFPLQL